MNRVLIGGLALASCIVPLLTETNATGARSLPMQFAWQQEGPAKVCGKQCRTWISAVGTITAETPDTFSAFVKTRDAHGATLVLDSGGGSVHGAIALGREVRRLGMTATVGQTIPIGTGSDSSRATLSPRADCESMCAFVLLAGVKRIVPPQARVMVHQIWLGDRRDDAAAATYSADDLVLVQRDIGLLMQYGVEMGASIDFLELSLRIPPWEPMHALTHAELQSMHVDTGPEPSLPAGAAVASAPADTTPTETNGVRRSADGAHGWLIVEQGGRPTLTRRHTLTVEGVEIGSFDITLACGATPDTFAVDYSERRHAQDGVMTPLKSVALSLGADAEDLQVVSSQPVSASSELTSLAQGSIPLKLIQWFSEGSSHALLVSTRNAREARTSIRVGNSGVGQGLAQLEQSCNRHTAATARQAQLAAPAGR
jgi:hypothetical protein